MNQQVLTHIRALWLPMRLRKSSSRQVLLMVQSREEAIWLAILNKLVETKLMQLLALQVWRGISNLVMPRVAVIICTQCLGMLHELR